MTSTLSYQTSSSMASSVTSHLTRTLTTRRATWHVDQGATGFLGRGGFGFVYRGKDVKGTPVAVKRVSGELYIDDPEVLLKLNHQNVLDIYDVHIQGDYSWIFMEFCNFGDLNRYFKSRDVPFKIKLFIMVQTAKGIEYLHKNNFVHRDIKPENILIANDSPIQIKLTDFDLSKFLDPDGASMGSVMFSAIGTIMYLAPESFSGSGYRKSVDTFSAGLTFLAILQATPGDDTLVPLVENPDIITEFYIPIAYILSNSRSKVNILDLSEDGNDPESIQVKKLIERMIDLKPKNRPTPTKVLRDLAKIADDFKIFEDFLEFPTPHMIQEMNVACGQMQPAMKRVKDDPDKIFPTYPFKDEVKGDLTKADQHALQMPETMMASDMEELISHLTSPFKSELLKMRTILRWLAKNYFSHMPIEYENVDEDKVKEKSAKQRKDLEQDDNKKKKEEQAKELEEKAKREKIKKELENKKSVCNWLLKNIGVPVDECFKELCLRIEVPCHIIKGKTRPDTIPKDIYSVYSHRANWVIVRLDNVWRIIHVSDMIYVSSKIYWYDPNPQPKTRKIRKVRKVMRKKPKKRVNVVDGWAKLEDTGHPVESEDTEYEEIEESEYEYEPMSPSPPPTPEPETLKGGEKKPPKPPPVEPLPKIRKQRWYRDFYERNYETGQEYFLPDPNQHIFRYFPLDDDIKQLLARPITEREFKQLAYVTPAFYKSGVKLKSHPRCVIEGVEGECTIEFDLTTAKHKTFGYRLWISASVKDLKELKKKSSDGSRFVYMTYPEVSVLKFKVDFPIKGLYKFDLYVGKEQVLCEYLIDCHKPKEHSRPLPKNPRQVWGPGEDLSVAGIEPVTHKQGTLEPDIKSFEMRFRYTKSVDLKTAIHNDDMTAHDMRRYLLQYRLNNEAVVAGKLPEAGDYSLELHVTDTNNNTVSVDEQQKHVCSYMITTDYPSLDPTPYPEVPSDGIGPAEENKSLGILPKSHPDPLINVPEYGNLEINMATPAPCKLMARLLKGTDIGVEEKENYTFVEHDPVETTIFVRIPETGNYLLELSAKRLRLHGVVMVPVYHYMLEVPYLTKTWQPFPKFHHPGWNTDCEVLSPDHGLIPADKRVTLAVRVPLADRVSLVTPVRRVPLYKRDCNMWMADVMLSEDEETVTLEAEVDRGLQTQSQLLEFKVEDRSSMDARLIKEMQMLKINKDKIEAHEREIKRRTEEFETVKNALLEALETRKVELLREAIVLVETKRLVVRLKKELEGAKRMMTSRQKIERLKSAVITESNAQLGEALERRSGEKQAERDILNALRILLGESQANGDKSQMALELKRRIEELDLSEVKPAVARRVRSMIRAIRPDSVREFSTSAGKVYDWVVGVIEEVDLYNKEKRPARPEQYMNFRLPLAWRPSNKLK